MPSELQSHGMVSYIGWYCISEELITSHCIPCTVSQDGTMGYVYKEARSKFKMDLVMACHAPPLVKEKTNKQTNKQTNNQTNKQNKKREILNPNT